MSSCKNLLSIMTKPWVIVLCGFMTVLAFVYVDKPLAEYFQQLNFRTNGMLLIWFTKLGLGIIYLPSFFLSALFFRYIRVNRMWEARLWFLWLCVVFTGIICVLLKFLLGRARPDQWFSEHVYGFYWLQTKTAFCSFPSGHATTIMAVTFGLCILFPRYYYAYMIIGCLVALSRVLLTHHYLTDVSTAFYLTILEVGLLRWFLLQRQSWLLVGFKKNI